ncbi:hypothetical protein [Paenibacillus alvei]|uniref:Integrase SAM-like N-terminal domain-containing protein n=1 Tax=Paenibacillus alvei TaxID=44250 RepID=A0AAP7DKU7_PAEAL|nr:hypothetical protein [Paenibacillus alvei]
MHSSYESNLKNRILPYFRHLKLDELNHFIS